MLDKSEFENMWDGSETGWQLVRHDKPVYLVELIFGDCGPNEIEKMVAAEFHAPIKESGGLVDDCPGFALSYPISQKRYEELRNLQAKHQLNLNFVEISPDDFLVLRPDGNFQSWLVWPGIQYRKPVVEKMFGAGIEIVNRHLK